MPSPRVPSDFKALIPNNSAALCDKYNDAFLIWAYVADVMAYYFNEDGSISNAFRADICALGCAGSGGTGTGSNPNMPAPTGVSASDGTFSDKIQIVWNAVTPPTGIAAVTQYKIYRALSTTSNPNNSVLIGTVSVPTITFDDPVDGDLSTGVTYNYWVRATNGIDDSGYSASNVGNASAVTTSLPPVTDLACTKGFYATGDGVVDLVWTPVGGASKWDIYRHTINDPTTAVLIDADVVPVSTGTFGVPEDKLRDNDGELVYEDIPPLATTVYYYWVVGKKDSPPAVSPKSNVDSGWIVELRTTGTAKIGRNEVWVVPGGITLARVVLFGGGAGGAGGGIVYGAGGGGGGGIAIGEIAVVAGGKLRVVSSPDADATSNAAAQTNGSAGFVVKLQYSASGTFADTVDKITTVAPTGGVYASAGGGAGGSGGGASVSGVSNSSIISGRAGGAGNGSNGGKSGYMFGGRRLPMSNRLNAPNPTNGGGASGSAAGSGSKASGGGPMLPDYIGGSGHTGWCVIAY